MLILLMFCVKTTTCCVHNN